MRRGWWRVVAIVSIATGSLVAGALAPALTGRSAVDGEAPVSAVATSALLRPWDGASLDRSIGMLRTRVERAPGDAGAWARLGLAYVRRAATAGDPTDYARAETAIDRSLAVAPGNPDGLVGAAVLSAAEHDFARALHLAERALAAVPFDPAVHGILGDALIERGRYADGFASFQRMVDLRPGTASMSRVSYARELTGDLRGAIRAMRDARTFAGTAADAAWTETQLGHLYLNVGRRRAADAAFRDAARLDPGSTGPFVGRAIVAAAERDVRRARRFADELLARNPAPEHAILVGDLAALAGRPVAAREAYALARAGFALLRSNGVNVQLELALFEADHGDPRRALVAARGAWAARRTVHAADAMAWALHVNGHDDLAARFARRARSLGTEEGLFSFHAGAIELARGHAAAGRALLREALSMDPWFSILGPSTARDLLDRGGRS